MYYFEIKVLKLFDSNGLIPSPLLEVAVNYKKVE